MNPIQQNVRRAYQSAVDVIEGQPSDVQLMLLLEDGEQPVFVLSRKDAGILVKKLLQLGILPNPDS